MPEWPRFLKADEAALVPILESEDYETPRDMANALHRAVYARLRLRDSFLGVMDLGGIQLPYGPFWSLSDANGQMRMFTAGTNAVIRTGVLHAPMHLDPVDSISRHSPICQGCQHPKLAHGFNIRAGPGCLVGAVWKDGKLIKKGCGCLG